MIRRGKKSESGQALVLIVLGVVALFGMSALAIDGGQVYAERRRAQNTSDTSSFAGALVIARSEIEDPALPPDLCSIKMAEIQAAAKARILSNDYDPDADPNVDYQIFCEGPRTDEGIYYLVEVVITSRLQTNFAHLIFEGPLATTVHATTRARPIQGLGLGYAMFGASDHNCNTFWVTGNATVDVSGGGIFSNSNKDSGSCQSGVQGGSSSIDVEVEDGKVGIGAAGGFSYTEGAVNPPPQPNMDQTSLPKIPTPNCDYLAGVGSQSYNKDTTIFPGIYEGIKISGGHVRMAPGRYCITSTGFAATGGSITTIPWKDQDAGVLIYIIGGDFDIGGNVLVSMSASNDLIDPSGNQWAGMLVYMDFYNTSTVRISGSSGSSYFGTIYAPGPASPDTKTKCVITGNGETLALNSQLICYSIELTGDGSIYLEYSDDQNFKDGGRLDSWSNEKIK